MFRGLTKAAIVIAAGMASLVAVAPAAGVSRIVGGTPAAAGAWPSIAALVTAGQEPVVGQFCVATLIDPEWVITSAACVAQPGFEPTPVPATSFDVVLGVTDLAVDVGQRIRVNRIVVHPGYNSEPYHSNVALIRLQRPATLGPTVAPMDLAPPYRPDLSDGSKAAEIAGWGATSTGDPPTFPNVLQQAEVPILSEATCLASPDVRLFVTLGSGLCTGPLEGGIGVCALDGGAPLTVRDGGIRTLVGVATWSRGCGEPNSPAAYERVDHRSFVFNPGTTLDVVLPTAPTSVATVPGPVPRSATVSWQPPAVDGGRKVTGYLVEKLKSGFPAFDAFGAPPLTTPANVTTMTFTGLDTGSYQFTVAAMTTAGVGPAARTPDFFPVSTSPVSIRLPTVRGVPRVGRGLHGDTGVWERLDSTIVASPALNHRQAGVRARWQVCPSGLVSCMDAPTPGFSVLVPRVEQIGMRFRLAETAVNQGSEATAFSEMTEPVQPRYATRLGAQLRVTQDARGRVTLRTRLVAEVGSTLSIQVLGPTGKPRVLDLRRTRINGHRATAVGTRRVFRRAISTSSIDIVVVFPGRATELERGGRLVLTATQGIERAVRSPGFRARMR